MPKEPPSVRSRASPPPPARSLQVGSTPNRAPPPIGGRAAGWGTSISMQMVRHVMRNWAGFSPWRARRPAFGLWKRDLEYGFGRTRKFIRSYISPRQAVGSTSMVFKRYPTIFRIFHPKGGSPYSKNNRANEATSHSFKSVSLWIFVCVGLGLSSLSAQASVVDMEEATPFCLKTSEALSTPRLGENFFTARKILSKDLCQDNFPTWSGKLSNGETGFLSFASGNRGSLQWFSHATRSATAFRSKERRATCFSSPTFCSRDGLEH